MFYIFRKSNGQTETVDSKSLDSKLARAFCKITGDTLHGPFGSVEEGMEGIIIYERWFANKRKK